MIEAAALWLIIHTTTFHVVGGERASGASA